MFCTYLTIYSGNKLPIFYIGSTSVAKVETGYRGSVSSNEYSEIWRKELILNPHLFKTKILTLHETRDEALLRENSFQVKLNAVYNPLYTNKGYAAMCYGDQQIEKMTVDNPMFNPSTRKQVSNSLKITWNERYDELYSQIFTKERNEKVAAGKIGPLNPNYGNIHSYDHINKNPQKCIYCDIITTIGNIKRWHNEKCKNSPSFIPEYRNNPRKNKKSP